MRARTAAMVVATVVVALGVAAGTASALPRHGDKGHKGSAKKHSHSKGMTAAEMAAMNDPTIHDRGFSALMNGMEHSHTFTQPVSKADRVLLAHQLELARQTALRYPTVADAEAGGLHRAGPFAPGLGVHYLNYANAGGAPNGVETDDSITKPLAWMYDGTHPDSRVVGLFYASPVANPQGFAGPNDIWHVHKNVCLRGVDAPLGADHDATKAQCDAVGGTLLKQTMKLLHVWVVPGWESPEGVFAHLSSAVACDDGTYHQIKDITKIGTRTTTCADGTE